MNIKNILTLGDLKQAGYKSKSIKEEMRANLIEKLRRKEAIVEGIHGYEDTVIPDLERAILSRHNIILLGLRGQAKTRIARLLVALLDEYVPIIQGSELNDDPLQPISRYGKDLLAEKGEDMPIEWLQRSQRYSEKLATPDVSIADLLGDVDPIKAAGLKLPYSDERVIHFGLIPRSHRCIFVINELPDLQARIQVALFNILQERDIQIRGFKVRMPLDIQLAFTANPEDYTNRGSIVTPLKDRIESQILTHYPRTLLVAKKITQQESHIDPSLQEIIRVPELIKDLVEQVAIEVRKSEYVDAKSGVSARLSISAYENLISAAERRLLINQETNTVVRISDLNAIVPSITGKVELVYEGEVEGPAKVAHYLMGKAIKAQFLACFPDPERFKMKIEASPYYKIAAWFQEGHSLDLLFDLPGDAFRQRLVQVPHLDETVQKYHPEADIDERYLLMELLLYGLAEFSILTRHQLDAGWQFQDLFSSMFSLAETDEDEIPDLASQ